MKSKAVSGMILTPVLIGMLALPISFIAAEWALVPNGSFESGTVGLIPDNWVMVTLNATDPFDAPKNATYIHEMQQTDQKYFEGGKSLWLHSRVVDEGLRIGRGSFTTAETEDWINAPLTTHVRIYIRDIKSTHSLGWGWANNIYLYVNNVSVAKTYALGQYWSMIFTHGETLNWNHYNYTAVGGDGESWYVYEYAIPESVDKTHMKIQVRCVAWDWTFYSTSYFSDLEFVVDKVELFSPPSKIGDVNGDGIVDIVDGVIIGVAFGSKPGDPKWNPIADIVPDNFIDIQDIVLWAIHFGEDC